MSRFRKNLFAVEIALIVFCSFLINGSNAAELTPQSLKKLSYEQKLGSQLNLDLRFVDDSGKPVLLRSLFGDKPAVLMMGYYECPMLCNLVLNGLVQSLQEIKPASRKPVNIIFVSIDPKENSMIAAAKKKTYLARYGSLGAGEEWHFLTGRTNEIAELAKTIGFNYEYDPYLQQYAHPSGLVLITPDGKVSSYMLGIKYASAGLQSQLAEARGSKIGSPVEQLLLLCFFYQPLTGKFSGMILLAIRAFAICLVAGLGVYIWRNSHRSRRPPGGAGTESRESANEISATS